jgi:acyl-CoA synthetase (NDP forming)
MNNEHFLDFFLRPRSVALVGVSQKTGRGTFNILENLVEFGFKGEMYPVNPHASEILGFNAYKNVRSLPKAVDLAVIMTPRDIVPEIVEQCAEKGIKGATIITEGFGEGDDKGRLLQGRIDDTVGRKGIRILGPNSIGILNSFHNFSSAFIPLPKNLAPVALISQSGGFFEGFPDCPFGKGIDLGNTSDVNFIDAISYFEKDDDIRVIVLYMEGIEDGQEFIGTSRRVIRSKPIIAVKGGRGESGSKAAASHTGSLSGKDGLYGAMFRQSRILQADSIAAVGDITKAFLSLPPFTGNRIAVITPTGAGGIITLDSIEDYGLQPAALSRETIEGIADLFQPWTDVGNPVDILSAGMAHGYKHVYTKVLESCLNDKNVDIVIAVCGVYTLKTTKAIVDKYPEKPVVAWIPGADRSFIAEKTKRYAFEPYYLSPDRALYALKMVREYYKQRMRDTSLSKEGVV